MRGATITLFKVKETGNRWGGYTSIDWWSPSGSPKPGNDPNAFLFSLDLKSYYPVQIPEEAIIVSSWYGPRFGLN